MTRVLAAVVGLVITGGQSLTAQRSKDPLAGLAGLDRYVEQAMAAWGVPGLSIAIVRGDSTIVARGYGVRRAGEPARVDPETIFAIGSNSKAFTTAALALLVEEGKLAWGDPVIRHLPWFQLADPWITRNLDLRDLVSHRSGVARHDALWYATSRSTEDVVRQLRFVETEVPFRTGWLYNNALYLTSGLIIERLSGKPWDQFVTERIFRPLRMTRASTTIRGLEGAANVARPHMMLDGKVEAVPYRNIDNAGPAGSINASATDMARWIRFQIDSGRVDGQPLLAPRQFAEMWRGRAVIQDPLYRSLFGPGELVEYGLGWFIWLHRQHKVILHGGNIDGMSALVSFIPDQRVGIVVLTNMNQSFVHAGITRWVYDRLLGGPDDDWSGKTLALLKAAETAGAGQAEKWKSERVAGTAPSLPLDRYAGQYVDSLYGRIEVRSSRAGLLLDMDPGHQAELTHWHFDTFRALFRDPTMNEGSNFVTFRLNSRGEVEGVKVAGFTEYSRRSPRGHPVRAP
jgi:CubicO group peptidase (beta-lactamase class C family)